MALKKIIIFEDERIIAQDLKATLEHLGYQVSAIATNDDTAVQLIKRAKPDLVLMDIALQSRTDGIKLARKIKSHFDIPIIYITAHTDHDIVEQAKITEPYGYLIKPFNAYDLKTSIEIALYKHRTDKKLRQGIEKLKKSLESTIRALSTALEKRDPYTAGHSRRVAQLARAIAKELMLPAKKLAGINMSAIIHDIGKIYVPIQILSKPSKLTENEFMIVKSHCEVGYEILKNIEFPWPIAEIVYQHHERIDGSGYPQGLKNGQILFEAKIIGVADTVEAMCSHRPYRPAPGMDKALTEINENRGILYEPDVVDACITLLTKKHFIFFNNQQNSEQINFNK